MRALLVAGDEHRFRRESNLLRRFLTEKAGVDDISLEKGPYDDPKQIKGVLRRKLDPALAVDDEPLLLAYSGHGNGNGWQISPGKLVEYEFLGMLLAGYPGKVLFLNACCFAGAAVSFLKLRGVSGKRLSFIGVVDENDETGDEEFLARVMHNWCFGKPHEVFKTIIFRRPAVSGDPFERISAISKEVFWGTRHDRYFYAKTAKQSAPWI